MAVAIVNHIQYPALTGGKVYCHWRDEIVPFDDNYYFGVCMDGCPYVVGRGDDGSGIEEQYWDPTLKPYDPIELITTAAQVEELYRRTRGLEKKTGQEVGYVTAPGQINGLTTLMKQAYYSLKAAPRTKLDAFQGGRKRGTVYFGDEVAFEITTRDPALESLAVRMITNPIQSSAGTSKIGDDNFEDVATAFLEESGYELREAE